MVLWNETLLLEHGKQSLFGEAARFRCVELRGSNKMQLGSPLWIALALGPNSFIDGGPYFTEALSIHAGCASRLWDHWQITYWLLHSWTLSQWMTGSPSHMWRHNERKTITVVWVHVLFISLLGNNGWYAVVHSSPRHRKILQIHQL